ncbi:TPA: hypothetical protein ACX6QF_000045 [Photobacterium damselae]
MNKSQLYTPFHSLILLEKLAIAFKSKDGLSCVLYACASSETFLNDLQAWYQLATDKKKEYMLDKEKRKNSSCYCNLSIFNLTTELEEKIAKEILNSEDKKNKMRTHEKYANVIKLLTDENISLQDKSFQDYVLLSKVRNAIAHSKTEIIPIYFDKSNKEIQPTIHDYPADLHPLFKRNILTLPNKKDTWLTIINTHEFCQWVLETIKTMIYNIVDNLPKDSEISASFSNLFYTTK